APHDIGDDRHHRGVELFRIGDIGPREARRQIGEILGRGQPADMRGADAVGVVAHGASPLLWPPAAATSNASMTRRHRGLYRAACRSLTILNPIARACRPNRTPHDLNAETRSRIIVQPRPPCALPRSISLDRLRGGMDSTRITCRS